MMVNSVESDSRVVLWAVAAFMLAVPLYFLFFKAPASGQLVEGTARLSATVVLLYFLLKLRNWARLTLAFFALTGSVYLSIRLGLFNDGLQGRELIGLGIKDIGYTASGLLLVFSRSLRDCLAMRGGPSGEETNVPY